SEVCTPPRQRGKNYDGNEYEFRVILSPVGRWIYFQRPFHGTQWCQWVTAELPPYHQAAAREPIEIVNAAEAESAALIHIEPIDVPFLDPGCAARFASVFRPPCRSACLV
ncbi:MAG: hypothetical protein WBF73_00115, partial [Bradyrhizobium sp.]